MNPRADAEPDHSAEGASSSSAADPMAEFHDERPEARVINPKEMRNQMHLLCVRSVRGLSSEEEGLPPVNWCTTCGLQTCRMESAKCRKSGKPADVSDMVCYCVHLSDEQNYPESTEPDDPDKKRLIEACQRAIGTGNEEGWMMKEHNEAVDRVRHRDKQKADVRKRQLQMERHRMRGKSLTIALGVAS